MPLKTFVKVGSISNLSDARYSAGMGVDLLGFSVLEDHGNYVTPKAFQEIRGWVSGPAIVAEVYGFTPQTDFTSITEQYAPDYFEFSAEQLKTLPNNLHQPIIVAISEASFQDYKTLIGLWKESIAYLLINDGDSSISFIEQIAREYPVLVSVTGNDVSALLSTAVKGIALNGSKELKPGLKDYDHLAEVLEQLDAD